jgi:hypothetical protein
MIPKRVVQEETPSEPKVILLIYGTRTSSVY